MSDTKPPPVPPHVRNAIESIRGRVIDIEASANAAAASLDGIPFMPRLPRHPRPDVKPTWTEEQRRDLGRVQSMVYATADVAEALLAEYNQILVAIGVEVDPGDDNGFDPNQDGDDEPGDDAPGDDAPAAVENRADALSATEPDPRPSLGRVVVDFRPVSSEEDANGVVTMAVEDIATRPFHRTPAEHEAALLTGGKTIGGDLNPRADDQPADATIHRS